MRRPGGPRRYRPSIRPAPSPPTRSARRGDSSDPDMLCPQCHSEYRAGVRQCADCGVDLVAELDGAAEGHRHGRWTQLCSVSTDTEATLIQGFLESAGIPCSLESLVFHAEPVNFGPLARVRLYVLDTHVDEARELLRERDDVPGPVSPSPRS